MIVAKVSRGSSFKGVTAYLRGTKENHHRAQWTATQNIGTENIEMAARVMAATAMDADAIKRANGWNGRGRGTTERPVYHAIMSWPQDMAPDAIHQEEAARDLLKEAGFENAQAIIVGHNDNGKTHAHIVVNVLDPETGKQFSLSNDQRKMQAWALKYCEANNIDLEEVAPNRKRNADAREQAKENGQPVNGDDLEGTKRLSRKEWNKMRKALQQRHDVEAKKLKKLHSEDWGFAKAKIAAQRKSDERAFLKEHAHQKQVAKVRNKPYWRDLFQRQRRESAKVRQEVEDAVKAHRKAHSFLGRVLSILPFRKSAQEAQADLSIARLKLGKLVGDHGIENTKLRRQLADQTFERTVAAIPKRGKIDLTDMKERHSREWTELRGQQDKEREAAGVKSRAANRERMDRLKAEAATERERMKQRDLEDKQREDDHDRDL